ncbi:uncharacterized protein [Neodiprion pinetum]|uniref:uncharacterized protein n=1 Tax=Neodiprion pinetum TaxID=441929 RepID=UPI0037142997
MEEENGECAVNKETLEIDGKYLKSLVNSRKSPKRCKDRVEKSVVRKEKSLPVLPGEIKASKTKEDCCTQCDEIDSVNSASQTDLNFTADDKSVKLFERALQSQFGVQGSLDSVKFTLPQERSSKMGLETGSKKSKSYESIKCSDSSKSVSYKSFEISYSDTLKPKSDSTSQLMTTANFCTECCYAAAEVSLNQETFYTVQSNRSTCSVDDDSTECDICSTCNLDSNDIIDPKSVQGIGDKCDLCEICSDINADFEGDLIMPYADSELTLVEESGAIEEFEEETRREIRPDESGDDFDEEMNRRNEEVDNDDFEIENCGLDNSVKSLVRDSSRLSLLQLTKNSVNDNCEESGNGIEEEKEEEEKEAEAEAIGSSNENVNIYSAKLSLPKYYLPIGSRRDVGKRIVRKGSFVISDSSCKFFQDKRRYSSVDNLQHSKQIIKLPERGFQRFKGNKLIASADNIQSNRTIERSAKLKKLQKSVNDIDSLTENFINSSNENFTLSENDLTPDSANLRANIKIRDSDMVKMILTKHGIKIISEKETAL